MTRKAKKGSKCKTQKTGLNRNMLDVGIGMLKSAIDYKVNEAGGVYTEIPTQKVKPSQTCPMCGRVLIVAGCSNLARRSVKNTLCSMGI